MKNKELQKKSKLELGKILSEQEGALRNFRLGVVGSKSRNVREGRELRRTIARVKTALKKANK